MFFNVLTYDVLRSTPFHVPNKRISFRPSDPKKPTPSVPRFAGYDVLRSRTATIHVPGNNGRDSMPAEVFAVIFIITVTSQFKG